MLHRHPIGTCLICTKHYGGVEAREITCQTPTGYRWRILGDAEERDSPAIDPYFELPTWVAIMSDKTSTIARQKAVIETQQELIQRLEAENATLKAKLAARGGA